MTLNVFEAIGIIVIDIAIVIVRLANEIWRKFMFLLIKKN